MIMMLFDTGVRAPKLCGMKISDLSKKYETIMVTGKADKQRRLPIGNRSVMSIERYIRKRKSTSEWLWLGSANRPLTLNGLRMML